MRRFSYFGALMPSLVNPHVPVGPISRRCPASWVPQAPRLVLHYGMGVARDEPQRGPFLAMGQASLGSRASLPRALIIDDEPSMAKCIRRIISEQCDVEIASTSGEGLALVLEPSEREYRLILCDWLMPDLGGEEVYTAIARSKPHLTRRFVLVTGGAFTPEARRFLDTTQVRCLEKPFELERLLGFVSEILQHG
jgi:CheY-like chemotaxis protein